MIIVSKMFAVIFVVSARTELGSLKGIPYAMVVVRATAEDAQRSTWKRISAKFLLIEIGFVYAVKWNVVAPIRNAKKTIDFRTLLYSHQT